MLELIGATFATEKDKLYFMTFMLENFNWDVSRRLAAQTFSLRANFQLGSLQIQLPPHPQPEFRVRISRTVRILSGSWSLGSWKLQSGFGLARVIDGMQQIKGEEEPRNNLWNVFQTGISGLFILSYITGGAPDLQCKFENHWRPGLSRPGCPIVQFTEDLEP